MLILFRLDLVSFPLTESTASLLIPTSASESMVTISCAIRYGWENPHSVFSVTVQTPTPPQHKHECEWLKCSCASLSRHFSVDVVIILKPSWRTTSVRESSSSLSPAPQWLLYTTSHMKSLSTSCITSTQMTLRFVHIFSFCDVCIPNKSFRTFLFRKKRIFENKHRL